MEPPDVQDRLVYCYPLRLAVPSPSLPSMEMHVENSLVCVRYKGEVVKVSRSYFSKLVRGVWEQGGGRTGGAFEARPGRGEALFPPPFGALAERLSPSQWLLYRYSCIDDTNFEHFLPRVWCLLRRYQVRPSGWAGLEGARRGRGVGPGGPGSAASPAFPSGLLAVLPR